jgi:hypothetical protein
VSYPIYSDVQVPVYETVQVGNGDGQDAVYEQVTTGNGDGVAAVPPTYTEVCVDLTNTCHMVQSSPGSEAIPETTTTTTVLVSPAVPETFHNETHQVGMTTQAQQTGTGTSPVYTEVPWSDPGSPAVMGTRSVMTDPGTGGSAAVYEDQVTSVLVQAAVPGTDAVTETVTSQVLVSAAVAAVTETQTSTVNHPGAAAVYRQVAVGGGTSVVTEPILEWVDIVEKTAAQMLTIERGAGTQQVIETRAAKSTISQGDAIYEDGAAIYGDLVETGREAQAVNTDFTLG